MKIWIFYEKKFQFLDFKFFMKNFNFLDFKFWVFIFWKFEFWICRKKLFGIYLSKVFEIIFVEKNLCYLQLGMTNGWDMTGKFRLMKRAEKILVWLTFVIPSCKCWETERKVRRLGKEEKTRRWKIPVQALHTQAQWSTKNEEGLGVLGVTNTTPWK